MLRNLSWPATHRALHVYKAIINSHFPSAPLCIHPANTAQRRHLQVDRSSRSRSAIMACEDCAKPAAEVRGYFWAGEPSGKEVKIHGMDTYIVEPASPTGKAVLLIPDIYGVASSPSDSCRQQPLT